MKPKPKKRGFAAMDPKDVRRICRMGGKTISRNRAHMKSIGCIGGTITQSRNRANAIAAKAARKST